jgi:Ca2+-binding EF-hand superfamily protein
MITEGSFLSNLTKIFVSDFDTRLRFTFNMYDFDNDGLISREDVQMVLYYVPMIKNQNYESNDY